MSKFEEDYGPVIDDINFNRTFIAEKSLLRLTGGVQHMVSECYGVRFLASWINTARFNYIRSKENAASTTTGQWILSNLKNSWSYGVGAFIKF